MTEEISIDFSRKSISPSIITHLEKLNVDEEELDWIHAVFKGSVLKKAEANQLIKCLLSALEIHPSEKNKISHSQKWQRLRDLNTYIHTYIH